MDDVDYYELLGIRRDASAGEVKTAFRALAKVMHPDAGGTAGTFRLLKSAYETLSDPRSRAEYDRGVVAAPAAAPTPAPRQRRRMYRDEPAFVPAACDVPPSSLPWWHLTKHQPRIGYVRTPGHAPAVGIALTGAVLAVPLLLPGWLPPVLLVCWLALVAAAIAVAVRLGRLYLAATRAQRAAQAEFGERTVFGEADEEPVGERLTADLLVNYLARLPGARVFHGLSQPGSVFADVDHAVLCGHRLVLVESKLWLPGHYEVDDDGSLWRNGHPFRGGATDLFDAVAAFTDHLPGVEVRGVLLLYPSRTGDVTTDPTPGNGVSAMTPPTFVDDIGTWLAADCATVDHHVLRSVRARVVREPAA
ncbi:J domain-containing protein [Actinokineospora globicatena]|uniref:J domain-containing protein n=1 Tax=Actinokineospora globicatena TaxID=103729 RepID=UPI0020A3AEC1|nr:DnaJ domain-containing protein [Actinokineospora globicatena]MCP2304706.1 DnaJ domain-containing protein [Actinokineospora globicatena]